MQITDMAVEGTSIPHDAGKMNTIPSVPNPHQASSAMGGLGAPEGASAADNPTDMPRHPRDMSTGVSEVITGVGGQMPGETSTKHTHFGGGNPLAKGSQRYDKHTKSKESDLEYKASGTHEVAPQPGEERLGQDEIRDSKGL